MAAHIVKVDRNDPFQFSSTSDLSLTHGQFGVILSHCHLKCNCLLKWLCLFGIWENMKISSSVWSCYLYTQFRQEIMAFSLCLRSKGNWVSEVTETKEKAWTQYLWYIHPRFWNSLKYNSICNPEGAGKDSWESFGQQGDQTSQFWRKSTLNIHWKDCCWSWSSNTSATWCEELNHWKRPWCWERLRAKGEEGSRGLDSWIASPAQWTWMWASLGR